MERARPVLMIVHAHPDDESSQTGGTLARYAAAGCRTVLVTCTDGSQGDAIGDGAKPGADGHDPREVASCRSGELDAAARALNVDEVVKLGYPDSGLLRSHRPDVVITYPPNGLSEHPDHVRTHDVVVAAHANVVANMEPGDRGPRLYYIAMSASRLREAQAVIRAAYGDEAWVPPDGLGVDDADITTVIDVAAFWDDKLRALRAHASQPDAALLLKVYSAAGEHLKAVARVEEYIRVHPKATAGEPVERDFFAALAHAGR
jgi:LmbE family N-acetylglucosaminyl deacetylase